MLTPPRATFGEDSNHTALYIVSCGAYVVYDDVRAVDAYDSERRGRIMYAADFGLPIAPDHVTARWRGKAETK